MSKLEAVLLGLGLLLMMQIALVVVIGQFLQNQYNQLWRVRQHYLDYVQTIIFDITESILLRALQLIDRPLSHQYRSRDRGSQTSPDTARETLLRRLRRSPWLVDQQIFADFMGPGGEGIVATGNTPDTVGFPDSQPPTSTYNGTSLHGLDEGPEDE